MLYTAPARLRGDIRRAGRCQTYLTITDRQVDVKLTIIYLTEVTCVIYLEVELQVFTKTSPIHNFYKNTDIFT
jgi:hypothetical protein